MVKMIDVANLADVSTATVSRVFTDPKAVAETTKEKVLEAVDELNYKPNVLARNLRKMETKTILVIVPDISNTFFSKVLRGIEYIAKQNNYKVLLGDTENEPDLEADYLNYLGHKYADGMIMLTARTDPALIKKIADEYPVVIACEYLEKVDVPNVSIDNISSARKATKHLLGLGHDRIAHITGPMDVILSQDRLKGYKQAMYNSKKEIDQLLIQEGDFTFESGYNIMMKLIALENPPTAVFAANDEMAIGAIKALKAKGLKVPDDVAVVGFDDIKMSSIYEPTLTTISQPMYKIGKKAMSLLLKLMDEGDVEKRQYVLKDELIIRDSCGR